MQANIENFLSGVLDNRRFFYIPVYQRNYSWKEEQCKVLFDDIIKLYNGEYKEHFIGSIVWKPDESNSSKLGVIDGQQRLTTMFLLIKAIHDTCEDVRLKKRLFNILVDDYKNENRLVPIKEDNLVYEKILKDEVDEITNKSSRIYLNYVYFKELLLKEQLDYANLFETFNNIKVIKMELDYNDNPQVIFESINSTGMSLSIADLIRNYLLMNEDQKQQEYLFEKYWYKFEQKLGLEDLVTFFEHYLNLKLTKKISRKDMYLLFKAFYVKENLTTEDFLKKISIQIDNYEYLVTEKEFELSDKKNTKKINLLKKELKTFQNNVVNMFLLEVVNAYNTKIINEEEMTYAFELSRNYIFRRSVIALGTNSMQKVFRYLFRQIQDKMDTYSFIDSLNYCLITSKRNSSGRFPSDEEFYEMLVSRNLYGKFKQLDYLLLSLENYNNKTTISSDVLTIEHILPQTLTAEWKEIIGNDKESFENNVNVLGNLTLTSYNSNMSNFEFDRKKVILQEESHIKLNEYLKDINVWNIKEIQKRGEVLAKRSLEIWKYPKIDSSIVENIENNKYNSITLEELSNDYLSLKLHTVLINEKSYIINSYRELLKVIVGHAYSINSNKFINIFMDSENYTRNVQGQSNFIYTFDKNTNEEIYSEYEVDNKILYIDTARSGSSIIALCTDILEEYDIDCSNVELLYY